MKKNILFTVILLLMITFNVLAQDDWMSFNLLFKPRCDIFSKYIPLEMSYVSGDIDKCEFGYDIGYEFIFYNNINIHVGMSYAMYFFDVSYSYDTPIPDNDPFIITRSEFHKDRIKINFGVSKKVYSNNFVSIYPAVTFNKFTHILQLFRTSGPDYYEDAYFRNGQKVDGYVDYFDLASLMYNLSYLNLSANFSFFQNNKVGFTISPFVETSIEIWNPKRYSSILNVGTTVMLSFNFK